MNHTPVPYNERLISLDIIRGFALLGIFLVNMPAFHSPDFLVQMLRIEGDYIGGSYWLEFLFELFINNKFYTIFSFLFGLGFFIFMNRAEQKGLNMHLLFLKRLVSLFLFGIVHLVFFWFGDILHLYAITGIVLLAFYKRKNKTILAWSFVFLFLIHALMSLELLIPHHYLEEINETNQQEFHSEIDDYNYIYQNGSYLDWVSYRFQIEVIPIVENIPFTMLSVLGMFLLGLYAGRLGIFNKSQANFPLVKKIQMITLLMSIPLLIILSLLKFNIFDIGLYRLGAIDLVSSLSGITMSIFYITSMLRIVMKASWAKRLRPIGYVGQMALTNYLMQTIISVILFLVFDLYGKVSLLTGTFLVVAIYIIQVIYSYLWFKKFRFGPFEWLWRIMTYGEIQPIKRE